MENDGNNTGNKSRLHNNKCLPIHNNESHITSSMILCMLLNYHIVCVFSAARIRFPVVTDLPLPHTMPPPVITTCGAGFSC